jgi:hypothetical protein
MGESKKDALRVNFDKKRTVRKMQSYCDVFTCGGKKQAKLDGSREFW